MTATRSPLRPHIGRLFRDGIGYPLALLGVTYPIATVADVPYLLTVFGLLAAATAVVGSTLLVERVLPGKNPDPLDVAGAYTSRVDGSTPGRILVVALGVLVLGFAILVTIVLA